MKLPGLHTSTTEYLDTPRGLFTASGIWFRTREASLRAWAGAVFEREPLAKLLADAERWLRSPQTVALWLLPVLLFVAGPLVAALATLAGYVGWRVVGPGLVSRAGLGLVRVLDLVLLQALFYVFALSMLAAQDRFVAVGVGLGGFVLLRWGVLRWATEPLVRPLWQAFYRLPVPDHVLRALILRAALARGVRLPEFAPIERQIRANMPGGKT